MVCLQIHDLAVSNLSWLYLLLNLCSMTILHVKGHVVVVIYHSKSTKPIPLKRPLSYNQLIFQASLSILRCCSSLSCCGRWLDIRPTCGRVGGQLGLAVLSWFVLQNFCTCDLILSIYRRQLFSQGTLVYILPSLQ